MHRFLTIFLCLSTLVMTQNVVASTPSSLDAVEPRLIAAGAVESQHATASRVADGGTQSGAGLLLLAAGLAGLSAAGSRDPRSARRPVGS
jgi:hypothetical protein